MTIVNKNIYLFMFYGLGDFIWATSVLSMIKSYDKNLKITVVTFNQYTQLIKGNPNVDNIITINSKYFLHKNKIINHIYKIFYAIFNIFKFRNIDYAIFLDDRPFFAMLLKILRTKNIYGWKYMSFGKNLQNIYSKSYTKIIDIPKYNDSDKLHVMLKYQLIIRSIFPTYNLSIPKLLDTDNLESKIKNLIYTNKKYKIALCTKGSTTWRYWPTNYFIKLITILNKKYSATFFILGNDKTQLEIANTIINTLKDIDIRNLVSKTNILEFKELIDNMNLLISVDTSAIHFAGVKQIPTIALYGQSLPEKTCPINSNAISICTYEDCSPCDEAIYMDNKICLKPKCMEKITPEIVIKEINKIFK